MRDVTASASAPRPLPIDPTLRKPYDQAVTHPMPARDPLASPITEAMAAGAATATMREERRPSGPVPVTSTRTTGGRPAGPPVRADRDRTPTGSAPISRRPNRRFEHRRGPSLIVVGGLLLIATIVSAILWNTIGADSDGGDFPTPASIDPASAGAVAPDGATATSAGVTGVAGGADAAGPASSPDQAVPASTAMFLGVRSYDLDPGDPTENDDLVSLVVDSDSATSWSTKCYDSSELGGDPVGIGITLQTPASGVLTVEIASESWAIRVYASLAADMPSTFAAWGEPIGTQAGDAPDRFEVPLTGQATHIAVVFTEVGPSRSCTADFPYSGAIAEVQFAPLA